MGADRVRQTACMCRRCARARRVPPRPPPPPRAKSSPVPATIAGFEAVRGGPVESANIFKGGAGGIVAAPGRPLKPQPQRPLRRLRSFRVVGQGVIVRGQGCKQGRLPGRFPIVGPRRAAVCIFLNDHGDEDFSFKGPKWTLNISFSRELNEACQKNSGQLNQQSILGEIRLPRHEHVP